MGKNEPSISFFSRIPEEIIKHSIMQEKMYTKIDKMNQSISVATNF